MAKPKSFARQLSAPPRNAGIAALILVCVAACGGVDGEKPSGDFVAPVVEWQIVFEDNFDGATLDAAKWNVELGDGCPDLCGWGNDELQSYGTDNITVAGGVLSIAGREELDGSYTSGRVNTNGKFEFEYGRVEVSARIPSGQGTWPAIWALHSDPTIYGPWPLSGEIDIMEAFNYGVDGNQSTNSTTHYGLPTEPYNGTGSSTDLPANADLGFHEYAIEWEKDKIRFFIDGQHFQTQNSDNWFTYYPAGEDGLYDPLGPNTLGLEDAPFDQAFHLLINFAIGGDPVGDPDLSTIFPQTLDVDYVRVYECANANPGTGRGCGIADASVVPLEDHDGGPLETAVTAQPFVESLDLFLDAPETITLTVGDLTGSNMLQAAVGFAGPGATVVNDPAFVDPDDAANTIWHVSVEGDVANVILTGEDLGDDLLLDTGFDFSGAGLGGDPVGEIVFDMQVNSMTPGTTLFVKLDSGFPNLGEVALPDSELVMGDWKTYSIKFDDLLANPGFVDCCGGTGVDLANVLNPFVFEVVGGDVDVYLDNIRVTNACYVVGACKASPRTKGIPDFVVFDDAVNVATWDTGIAGSDSGSGWSNYTDGANPANKANWAIIDDADAARGQVIDVTFNDSGEFGVWFIGSTGAVDMNAFSAGAVVFDIIVDDYGNNDTGMTMKVDCFFPCTSGDKNLGVIADGVWETVTVPVSSLTGSGLDLNAVNTGVVIFPTSQSGTIRYRLDNIRWIAETEAPPLAQIDLPVTFEDAAVDYSLADFGGNATSLIADPTNASNTVASSVKAAGAEVWAGTVVGTDAGFANPIPFAAGDTLMSVSVYSPAVGVPILFRVENADNSVGAEVLMSTTVADQWETITYDFSTVGIDTAATFVKAVLFFDFDQNGTGATYLWDNVVFGAGGPVATPIVLPITFDDASVDYELQDFGGNATSLIADPDNAANTVASSNKVAGAEVWAGTTVANVSGFAAPIPFSATETSMTVRVYSPVAGIPVLLKVEDKTDGTISVETLATTSLVNTWETLTFDFSNEAAGTAALDLANTYDKASVFFDFGTNGDDSTYLWDDMTFVTSGGGGGGDAPTVAAPTPTQNPADVVSMFSDTYVDVVVDTWRTDWSSATLTDIVVDGNAIKQYTDLDFVGIETASSPLDVSGMTHFHVDVWTPNADSLLIKLVDFGGDGFGGGNDTEGAVTFDASSTPVLTTGTWISLDIPLADFQTAGLVSLTDINQLIFAATPSGTSILHVTNVYFYDDGSGGGGGSQVALPITFDDAAVDYELTDFGGNATTLIADPDDAANTVASSNKVAGAETWAGTTVANVSGFISSIPFSATETSMTVRVYSPVAGIPVRLKVENAADATVSVETEAMTTMVDTWETLTFDFSNEATGTAALNLASTYNKASIFFDFGANGDDSTYLWDDITFVSSGGGGGGGSAPTSTDFEGDPGTYAFTNFDGGVATVIANPQSGGINTSAQVVQMQKFAGQSWGGTTLDLGGAVDWSAGEVYSVKVWSSRPVPVLLKLEGLGEERTVNHTGSGWEVLCFDFTGTTGGTPVTAITLIFDNGVMGDAAGDAANWTFYFDDIDQSAACGGGAAVLPIDFEGDVNSYDFGVTGGFDGGAASVIANPEASGINTSAQVGQMLKYDGQTWGGATLTLDGPVDIPAGSSFTMKVWSQRVVPVLFKLEGGPVSELPVNHGGTGWEELSFDFSSISGSITGITLIFDNGTMGAAATDPTNWTFYFDDIDLVPTGGGGGGSTASDPIDFEPAGLGAGFAWATFENDDNPAVEIVANPDASGTNTSATVAQFTARVGGQQWAGTETAHGDIGPITLDASNSNIKIMVYKNVISDVGIKFAIADGGAQPEIKVPNTLMNQWEELTFDFSGNIGLVESIDIDQLIVFPDFQARTSENVVYFDNIVFTAGGGGGGGGSPIVLPVTFDDAGVDYELQDFGGNATTLIADPDNAANTVASSNKIAGSETWAGTTVANVSGFASPIPFSATETTMTVRVYSPVAGIPVLLKVEDKTNGTISVETLATTTMVDTWETLTFDFSNEAAGTAALDLANTYDKASVFFDFGTNGDGATYLWDDMEWAP